ncbi:hypothetical protein ACFE04_011133 [Oxalis oulophora]
MADRFLALLNAMGPIGSRTRALAGNGLKSMKNEEQEKMPALNMTEVLKSPVSFSGGILKDRSAVSVKRYEAKPPANLSTQLIIYKRFDRREDLIASFPSRISESFMTL